jgi:hypothetical protein
MDNFIFNLVIKVNCIFTIGPEVINTVLEAISVWVGELRNILDPVNTGVPCRGYIYIYTYKLKSTFYKPE